MKSFISIGKISFILIFFLIGSASAYKLEETFKKKIPFSEGGLVELRNVNGGIVVEGWNRDEVFIIAEKRVKAGSKSDALRAMKRLKIEIDQDGDRIYILTRRPHKKGSDFFDWLFGEGVSTSVHYTLKVPERCDLKLRSTNGGIEVTNLVGKIELRTTNGKISGDHLTGIVRAKTTNGSIRIDLNRIADDGEMEFLTTNGRIILFLPNDIRCELSARTTNGSIETDFPLKIRGKYNRKSVRGSINGGGPLIFLQTTNGSISIREKGTDDWSLNFRGRVEEVRLLIQKNIRMLKISFSSDSLKKAISRFLISITRKGVLR